ncbi:EF-hand domain-containing protein 1 isoform X1 [Etheostoma spectabile]|uniref:EF-hand domain-containing protein 1 isoform X1 n=1 Tax=Etheostoma spectabile TaxID=54343 RepID=UPI0013AF6030|nr:EF-hand domain-containing protein 1 isoform X1 [Etheostoma spectabile]
MSGNWNNGLPFLPGYSFSDVTKSAFHRPQTMNYKNGYALPRRPTVGIGQDPLFSEQLIQQEISKLSSETPDITYGSFDQSVVEDFIPAYVALDKKVLRYYAYFQENVLFSPEEECHTRPVVIYYYLEDDSMSIIEPVVENSGMPQGKRIKRQCLPKNERGDHYQWKDLNIGMDLEVYGVKYHITQCDAFTKEFLESEGIVLNDPEPMPCVNRDKKTRPSYTTPSKFDNKQQFLTMDCKVLRFFALWDDADSPFGETRLVTIQYYLVDDTVEIREIHKPNSGRDPFPVLMRRQKLPKKIKPDLETFPGCVLEVSTAEVDEYYSPKDFQVGQRITLLGRHILLYDCDGFTKEYYQKNHPDMKMNPSKIPKKIDLLQKKKKKEVPPYNGFGSLEDSLQNCLYLIPEPPKKNVLKMQENDHKVLRYCARLDSPNPVDEGRRFILSYFLSNDMISIYEKPSRNSGIIGGLFLEKTRVPKPGSTLDDPDFYSPADFAIGATVEVFSRRFVLTDADHYVLKYLESNASQIPCQTLDSLRQKLGVGTTNNQPADQNGDDVGEPSS